MSLPPIDQALLPASVRHGSATDKKAYASALAFEQVLLGELTKSMTATASAGSTDTTDTTDASGASGASDSATTVYSQMLPDQLAAAVTAGGGLGVAGALYDSMRGTRK